MTCVLEAFSYPYEGFYFLVSIAFGFVVGTRRLDKQGINETEYWRILIPCFIGAIVGGRLFNVLFWDGSYFLRNPLKIFSIWEGGTSITGAIAVALLTALIACRINKTSLSLYLSELGPTLLLSQGIGRIGCFLNGDAFGIPTSLPWGVKFQRFGIDLFSLRIDTSVSSPSWMYIYAHGFVSSNSTRSIALHPTQIYESAFDFAFAYFLLTLQKRHADRNIICYAYIAGYCLFRFLVEYIHGDREKVLMFNTTIIQFILLAVSIGFLILILQKVVSANRLRKSA